MNLWYINISLNPETGFDVDYRYEFTLHTRFISNYLSKQIRKHRFATDGTFNMVSVNPTPNEVKKCRIVPDAALVVELPFDKARYEKIKGTVDCEYYVELLEVGFRKASQFKEIPLSQLLKLTDEFRKNGYRNEWQHKKKRFKEYDVEVILDCYFTTLEFKLVATINKISTKEELCSGAVLITEPDEICFDKMFKDILIKKDKIIITDGILDSPRILINLKDALKNVLNYEFLGYDEMISAM